MARLSEHLSPAVRGLAVSSVVAMAERVSRMRAAGEEVYGLALGQSPFPVPERIVDALRINAGQKEYLPPEGLPALRKAVAHFVERRVAIDRTEEDVLIGPGSKELLFLLQMAFAGEIVVPTPSWTVYLPQARLLGREVTFVHARPEHGFMVTASELDRALAPGAGKPRLLVLNYPNNPTGLTYRPEELRELAKVARAHDVLVLSDEIYGELHHKGQHASIAKYYPEGTILSGGMSKWLGAGGWRLGTFVFPQELSRLRRAMTALASETFTSTSAPISHAATVAFEGGDDIERYLTNVRRVLAAIGRQTARRLGALGLGCAQPMGGFHVLVDFGSRAAVLRARGITTSEQLTDRLLSEAGVALLPGSAFGRPDDELTARLSYVDFDGVKALAAVQVIPKEQPLDETFLRRQAPRILAAIDAIAKWIV
ncbi:MAG: aminotransferase class I/II-fold pyridoxal phosphate-dependent enzyme [Sandaracinus sp.]